MYSKDPLSRLWNLQFCCIIFSSDRMVVSLSEECWSYTNFWTFFGWWWLRCIVRFTSRLGVQSRILGASELVIRHLFFRGESKVGVKFWREKKHDLHLDHDIFCKLSGIVFLCSQDKSNSIVIEKKPIIFMKPLFRNSVQNLAKEVAALMSMTML